MAIRWQVSIVARWPEDRGQRAVSPQLSITLVWAGCVLAAVISEESVNININKH